MVSRRLDLAAIASAHGPVLRNGQIDAAFARTLDLAAQPPVPLPGSELLDAIVAGALALAS